MRWMLVLFVSPATPNRSGSSSGSSHTRGKRAQSWRTDSSGLENRITYFGRRLSRSRSLGFGKPGAPIIPPCIIFVALLHHLHHALHVRALHRTVWALRLLRIESGRGGGAGDEDASEGEGYHEVTHGRISFRRGVQAASGRLARSRIELRSEPGSQLTLQSPRSI